MHSPLQIWSLALLGLLAFAAPAPAQAPVQKNAPGVTLAAPSISFAGVEYLHRWSKGDQHELTPRGQEDLERWTDMITVIYYRQAKDGDGLAAVASSVLEAYKRNQAVVLKTESLPRTAEKPAEHFVTVTFNRPGLSEAVYARFVLRDGMGLVIIRSHRTYGPKAARGHRRLAPGERPRHQPRPARARADPRRRELEDVSRRVRLLVGAIC